MKIRKSFVVFGVFMAFSGMFCASVVPRAIKHAEALVLVKDPENIAEAIKIVTNTLDILSAEQKQIVLQLLNLKKIDRSELDKFGTILHNDMKVTQGFVEGENDYALKGILSGRYSTPTTWDGMLGSVTDIFSGHSSSGGCFGTGKPGLVLLDRIGRDAVMTSKTVQQQDMESGKLVLNAVEASEKAEGTVQAIQAGNTILAAQTQTIEHGNQILANLTAVMAANAQRENLERAKTLEQSKTTIEYLGKFNDTLPSYEP